VVVIEEKLDRLYYGLPLAFEKVVEGPFEKMGQLKAKANCKPKSTVALWTQLLLIFMFITEGDSCNLQWNLLL